jgi:hypothetical protein
MPSKSECNFFLASSTGLEGNHCCNLIRMRNDTLYVDSKLMGRIYICPNTCLSHNLGDVEAAEKRKSLLAISIDADGFI